MIKFIREFFSLLTYRQKKQFYILQILVVIMAIFEIVSIASIAPFMIIVGNIDLLQQDNILTEVYLASGLSDPYIFLLWLGGGVLLMLTLAAILSMFTLWLLLNFAAKMGSEISDRLYTHYMGQPWLFHANTSSAQLTKQISSEALRVTEGIIQPVLHINAKVMLVLFLSASILAYNPLVAITGLIIIVIAYFVLYKSVRNRLQKNGLVLSQITSLRFRLMNEGFGGIKDVLLLDRKQDFIDQFSLSGEKLAHSRASNNVIAQVPRYFMELIAFGIIIMLVLYLLVEHQGELGAVLPIISVYALAGFKILPAFQQIYSNVALIKANIAAFEAIKPDLVASQESIDLVVTESNKHAQSSAPSMLIPTVNIVLNNISFSYSETTAPALNHLNMTIPARSIIGIVGASGSGKSTAIDVILSLIEPQQGELLIDGKLINSQNRRAWQNSIGFVPQSIFLSEGNIAENVAFGIRKKDINQVQVEKAIRLAHLDSFVKDLPEGIYTKVGERGVKLSGGQRQRIGIARALYYDASVLVFDEATSALDGITEKMIMDAIHDFSGEKTIIMIAHRLKTVQKCDIIFMIDRGEVVAQGSYTDLLDSNEQFKKMAEHA